jgi:DNA-binding CsgD family transcriptional regulator
MQILKASATPCIDGASIETMCRLVDGVGRTDFVTRLLGAAQFVSRADYVSIFVFPTPDRPIFIGTDSSNSPRLAQLAAEHYASGHYRDDPNVELLFDRDREPGVSVTYMRRDEITRPFYRMWCYDRAQILDRLSLLTTTEQGHSMSISFYRATRSGEFSDAERDALVDFGPLVRAVTMRHIGLPGSQERNVDTLMVLTRERFPHLSRRETETVAGVVGGLTAQQIGDWLGIAPTSVITHRKRAYAHLGVANQRELVALFYSS